MEKAKRIEMLNEVSDCAGAGGHPKDFQSVYLYDTNVAMRTLTGIKLAAIETDSDTRYNSLTESQSNELVSASEVIPTISDTLTCLSCDITCTDREHQKEHYRSDFHRFNLKQKMKTLPPVSEAMFEEITGDISSISGSDSESSGESDSESSSMQCRKGIRNLDRLRQTEESDDEGSFHLEGDGRRHPRVFLRNDEGELVSIYRCIVHGKKNQPENIDSLLMMTRSLPNIMTWGIFMTGGGHFAGVLFDKDNVIVHKTFHRYVVRAKRGTAQGTHDQKGNAPKSGGATLRRYNEAALTKDIQDLIESWKEQLAKCSRIFIRAPSSNKAIFFGGKTPPFDKNDPRIRMIPFATRRPTFKELRRVHTVLASIHCHGKESSFSDYVPSPQKKPNVTRHCKTDNDRVETVVASSSSSSEEATSLVVEELTLNTADMLNPFEATKKPHRRKKKKKAPDNAVQPSISTNGELVQCRNDLYTACKMGNTDLFSTSLVRLPSLLRQHLKIGDDTGETNTIETTQPPAEPVMQNVQSLEAMIAEYLNDSFGDLELTLLHVAAEGKQGRVVWKLLESGADPAVKDGKGQLPYVLCQDKETRNQFRKFRAAYPDRYDYDRAQIPEPLSSEREEEKKAREAEKKKAQRKARKERLKEQNQEKEKVRSEEQEQKRYLALSDREKRALAAEKRLTSQLAAKGEAIPVLVRCWQCGRDITGKVPFEYYDYKFCTTKCLRQHKQDTTSSR